MKILFSPSEAKILDNVSHFDENKLIFPNFAPRNDILNLYKDIINSNNEEQISIITGLKNLDNFQIDFNNAINGIKRYSGVAFKYLDFDSLDNDSKDYLGENLLIFSNLFGVLRANDDIFYYKLKQGQKLANIDTQKFYAKALASPLDEYLEDEEILDLRANYYEKFYKTKNPSLSFKFEKNGKVISHFAKAYRGLVLRNVALNKCDNLEAVLKLKIPNLNIKELIQNKNNTLAVFEIIE